MNQDFIDPKFLRESTPEEELDRLKVLANHAINRLSREELESFVGQHWKSKEIDWKMIVKYGPMSW